MFQEALLESKTKSLEREVEELIHKLRDLKKKQQSDYLTISEEQNISKNLHTTNGHETTQNLYDKIIEESILYQKKAPQKRGKSQSSRTWLLQSDSETSSGWYLNM